MDGFAAVALVLTKIFCVTVIKLIFKYYNETFEGGRGHGMV